MTYVLVIGWGGAKKGRNKLRLATLLQYTQRKSLRLTMLRLTYEVKSIHLCGTKLIKWERVKVSGPVSHTIARSQQPAVHSSSCMKAVTSIKFIILLFIIIISAAMMLN